VTCQHSHRSMETNSTNAYTGHTCCGLYTLVFLLLIFQSIYPFSCNVSITIKKISQVVLNFGI